MDTKSGKSYSELKDEIIRLGPWHHVVQVAPEISTKVYLEAPEGTYPSSGAKDPKKVSLLDDREKWIRFLERIYPEGLAGRTFLECACNCAAYSFWARELGASSCFGFDVREHWIDQARFLAENRTPWPTDGMRFEVLDLYDLAKLGLEPFDVTLFKGIFYHLPDPIRGLKVAADLTEEVLILDTAVRIDLPDGMLAVSSEDTEAVMTGVYGLNWHPTGPGVLERVLRWMGFADIKLVSLLPNPRRKNLGRLRMVASREEGFLPKYEPSSQAARTTTILKDLEIPRRPRRQVSREITFSKELEHLKTQNESLRNRLRDIENSATWRLFAPYRWLRAKTNALTKPASESIQESDDTRPG